MAIDYRVGKEAQKPKTWTSDGKGLGFGLLLPTRNLYLSNQSRHIAPRYFSLVVSYDGYSIRLGKGGKTELLRAVPDKMLALETSVNIALRTLSFQSRWLVAGGTSGWQHTKC